MEGKEMSKMSKQKVEAEKEGDYQMRKTAGVCTRMYRYRFEPTASACLIFERKEDVDADSPKQCQFCKSYEIT